MDFSILLLLWWGKSVIDNKRFLFVFVLPGFRNFQVMIFIGIKINFRQINIFLFVLKIADIILTQV